MINWKTDEWEYRDVARPNYGEDSRIELMEPRDFIAAVRADERVYVAYVKVNDYTPGVIIGIVQEVSLPPEYAEYADVFSEKEASELLLHSP